MILASGSMAATKHIQIENILRDSVHSAIKYVQSRLTLPNQLIILYIQIIYILEFEYKVIPVMFVKNVKWTRTQCLCNYKYLEFKYSLKFKYSS